jgi:hypothetical protein
MHWNGLQRGLGQHGSPSHVQKSTLPFRNMIRGPGILFCVLFLIRYLVVSLQIGYDFLVFACVASSSLLVVI